MFTKNTRISYLGEIVIDFVSEDELNTELYNPHIFVNFWYFKLWLNIWWSGIKIFGKRSFQCYDKKWIDRYLVVCVCVWGVVRFVCVYLCLVPWSAHRIYRALNTNKTRGGGTIKNKPHAHSLFPLYTRSLTTTSSLK